MADVYLYTTQFCPYCIRARQLLDSKGVQYRDIPVDGDSKLREQMTREAGGAYTVPQIWINGHHVGGCTDLMALDASGELDRMLAN